MSLNIIIVQTCFIFQITLEINRNGDENSLQHLLPEVSSGFRQMEGKPILNLKPSADIFLFYFIVLYCWNLKRVVVPGNDHGHKTGNNYLQFSAVSTSILLSVER